MHFGLAASVRNRTVVYPLKQAADVTDWCERPDKLAIHSNVKGDECKTQRSRNAAGIIEV